MISTRNIITGAVIASSLVLPFATQAAGPARHGAAFTELKNSAVKPNLKTPAKKNAEKMKTKMPKNAVIGTVAAVNGSSITLTGLDGTTYTIDASNAKLAQSASSQLTISNIQVGDKISAAGTVTGTSVVAKMISDSSFMGRNIFNGTVTAVSGSSATISSMKKTTYTVDMSQASITRMSRPATKGAKPAPTTLSASDVKIGDRLMIVGTLSGSTINATKINDPGSAMNRFESLRDSHFGKK